MMKFLHRPHKHNTSHIEHSHQQHTDDYGERIDHQLRKTRQTLKNVQESTDDENVIWMDLADACFTLQVYSKVWNELKDLSTPDQTDE